MRPRKHILLYCTNEFKATQLRMVMEVRLRVDITIAEGAGAVAAIHNNDFHCAVISGASVEFINILRIKKIPSLEIGHSPSYADRVVSGEHMMNILEAVRISCSRKRGPKVRVAA